MAYEKYPVSFKGSYYNRENAYSGFFTVGAQNGCLFDDSANAEYMSQFEISKDLLKNGKLITDFRNWVGGGSRTMVYKGETVKVNGQLLINALNHYSWSLAELSLHLLEQSLPVTFIDVDKVIKEHSGLQTNTLEGRYNIVSSFIASLENATNKNKAMLDKYGEPTADGSKYQTFDDYISEKTSVKNKN